MEDEEIVALIQEALDSVSLVADIYVNVVPVYASFPCVRVVNIGTELHQTKDGSESRKHSFKCYFIAKEGGVINGVTYESAFAHSMAGADLIHRYCNSYEPLGVVNGVKAYDLVTDYDDEVGVYFVIIDIDLIIKEQIMFSITPRRTGSKIGGKDVWVKGFDYVHTDFTLHPTLPIYYLDSGLDPDDVSIIKHDFTTAIGSDGVTVVAYDTDGNMGKLLVSLDLLPGQMVLGHTGGANYLISGYWFIYYTID